MRRFSRIQVSRSITLAGTYPGVTAVSSSHFCGGRKFDLVLFWSLDRLSREGVSATLGHLERLTSYGVGWRSHTEEYLDSTGIFKDAVIAILAVIAKQERIRRSERAKAAIAKLRRQGKTDHLGRPRRILPRDKIRQLHQQGLGVRAIANELGNVSHMTVHRVLQRG